MSELEFQLAMEKLKFESQLREIIKREKKNKKEHVKKESQKENEKYMIYHTDQSRHEILFSAVHSSAVKAVHRELMHK
jgi:hypothetical protein